MPARPLEAALADYLLNLFQHLDAALKFHFLPCIRDFRYCARVINYRSFFNFLSRGRGALTSFAVTPSIVKPFKKFRLLLENANVTLKNASLILTFELDPYMVKLSQYVKYVGNRSFRLKVTVRTEHESDV